MSLENKTTATCPQCKEPGEFTVWSSINTTLDPDKKAAVMDGSLFLFTCPKCGAKTIAVYPCLYHDMEKKLMIYLAPTDAAFQDAMRSSATTADNDLMKTVGAGYIRRIVRTVNELREKVMIFEAGLDDRIVELFKSLLETSMKAQDPSLDDISFLYFRDGEEDFVQAVSKGQTIGVSPMVRELYDDLALRCKAIDLPDISEDVPVIGKARALEIAEKLNGVG